jgi:lipoprotein-anchoring transpeptidase ErfK/SrfK
MSFRILAITVATIVMACAWLPAAHAAVDTDADGVADAEEERMGINPTVADSDGDGYLDGIELRNGYDPNSPVPAKLAKRIEIDLATQQLHSFLGPYDLGGHAVSTGKRSTPTPRGTFHIASKAPRAWSSRAHLWMPWWMNFVGNGAPASRFGLHELPEWPGGRKEGATHLGRPVSGGCIRLGVGPAKTLYDWAEVGTTVVVR